MRKNKFSLSRLKCDYCYISKDLKKAILKHQKELQKKEDSKNGRKAQKVTFSFASKDIVRSKKWFF